MTPPSRTAPGASRGAWIAALPDFGLAAVALLTWVRPGLLGSGLVRWFVMLMLLEFIVVHSAGFLGMAAFADEPLSRRIRGTILIGLFYSLFLVGFALSFQTWWPIGAFWLLILNRLLGAMLGGVPTEGQRELVTRGWGAGAACYVLMVMPTVLLPLPPLGIRRDMLGPLEGDTSGLWISEPHRAVAFAVLYFTAVGLSGAFEHRWIGNHLKG